MAKIEKQENIDIAQVQTETMPFYILGKTPLILQSMNQKAMRELLMPHGKKNAAEKACSLKHDPIKEYRDAPYKDMHGGPTLLQLLATSFKNSLKGAALDLPGAKKSQIGRLTWVEGERVAVYGAPKIFMAITRCADMNKTPDVRTRCIVPEWAAKVEVSFVKPILNGKSVANLLSAAGITQGVGDWRPEKGSGTYGQFTLVNPDNADWKRIIKEGQRKVQEAGLKNPVAYDDETGELLEWIKEEADRKGLKLTK